jgi:hypothetical protein
VLAQGHAHPLNEAQGSDEVQAALLLLLAPLLMLLVLVLLPLLPLLLLLLCWGCCQLLSELG